MAFFVSVPDSPLFRPPLFPLRHWSLLALINGRLGTLVKKDFLS